MILDRSNEIRLIQRRQNFCSRKIETRATTLENPLKEKRERIIDRLHANLRARIISTAWKVQVRNKEERKVRRRMIKSAAHVQVSRARAKSRRFIIAIKTALSSTETLGSKMEKRRAENEQRSGGERREEREGGEREGGSRRVKKWRLLIKSVKPQREREHTDWNHSVVHFILVFVSGGGCLSFSRHIYLYVFPPVLLISSYVF